MLSDDRQSEDGGSQEVQATLSCIQITLSSAAAAFKAFQSDLITKLDALQACVARESVCGEFDTGDDEEVNDGSESCGGQVLEPTLAGMSGAKVLEQPPVQWDYRGSRQERAKAGTLIQAWWRMHLSVMAVGHFIRAKDIKASACRYRALDVVIDRCMCSRPLPVVHERCV